MPALGQAPRSRITNIEMRNPHAARLPYTAEYKISHVKMLADGTTITHESTEVVAVDSQGRRLTATTMVPISGDQTPVTRVSVFDPVARTNSNWSVPGQRATVIQMPAPGAQRSSCATTATARIAPTEQVTRVRPTVEDLGVETINGVEARGRRTTTTTPAGAIGNNEPLVRTNEMWTAVVPGLNGLVVRQTSNDPQGGQMTKELTNLTQSEPDASVFQPPAGYEIVNKDAAACPSSSAISMEPTLAPPAAEAEPEQ
jgi:hypothetical protein